LQFNKKIRWNLLAQPCRCESQITVLVSSLVGLRRALKLARRSDSLKTRPGGKYSGLLVWIGWPWSLSFVCVRLLCTTLFVSLCRDDCLERAFDCAYLAAVTTVYVYEGRLIAVDADDGLCLAHLLSQAPPTNVAAIIVDVERCVADGGTYQGKNSFHQFRCTSAQKVTAVWLTVIN
jgi:hypothetical protein